jgi:hypothetical protein
MWFLKPSYTGSQLLRDSCDEVLLAARYIRSNIGADIDIPDELQEVCPEACRILKHHYESGVALAKRPINHFGDHETLINSASKQFYYLTYHD